MNNLRFLTKLGQEMLVLGDTTELDLAIISMRSEISAKETAITAATLPDEIVDLSETGPYKPKNGAGFSWRSNPFSFLGNLFGGVNSNDNNEDDKPLLDPTRGPTYGTV